MDTSQELQQLIAERLAALPRIVRDAITSSEIQQHLRDLAETYKLHVDQWDALEQEVMLTLLGVHEIDDLEVNISDEVGIPIDRAQELAGRINSVVFEPIREELERQLEHPEAREKELSGIETARNQELANDPGAGVAPSTAPTIQPATPPAVTPDVKVARPSDSTNYRPGETSAQRAAVHDDPYREAPL